MTALQVLDLIASAQAGNITLDELARLASHLGGDDGGDYDDLGTGVANDSRRSDAQREEYIPSTLI